MLDTGTSRVGPFGASEGVRAVISDYVEACDEARLDDWRSTFLPDGVLEVAEAVYRGDDINILFRARVATKLRERAEGRQTRHHLTSQRVKVQPDGTATAWTYFQLLRNGEIEETGIYRDTLQSDEGGIWKISYRHVAVEFRSANAPSPERPRPGAQ